MSQKEMSIPNSPYYQDREVRQRVDALLKEAKLLYANTGRETTKEQMDDVRRRENELIDIIAVLDHSFAKRIRPYG